MEGMDRTIMKKRHELPAFKKLDMQFDVERLIEEIRNMPTQQDDLREKGCYGVEVGGKAPKLQKAFGLKFNSIEDAYKFLQDNDVEESELRKGLGDKRMAWDYRNYVKPFDNYIVKGDDDKYHVSGSPYKQIALTEYNPDMEDRIYEKKIPKSRLDERHYNKIKDWVKGTYLEEVINSFKSETTRARIAIMDPGAFIAEHIDYNTDYSVRYHIPIVTNKDCGFYCVVDGQKVYQTMEPGSVWFLNQGLRHSAWNKGKTVRSHIIVSVNGQEDLVEN
jgi:hypothetical protein